MAFIFNPCPLAWEPCPAGKHQKKPERKAGGQPTDSGSGTCTQIFAARTGSEAPLGVVHVCYTPPSASSRSDSRYLNKVYMVVLQQPLLDDNIGLAAII